MRTFAEALRAAGERPDSGTQAEKKNYAERLSRHLATTFANALRPRFPGILPDEDGSGQESKARTSKGVKKLDVNYSHPMLGLGLGVSIKTLNFPDDRSGRYTKNFTRIDNELRAEAMDYHQRQPFAVMVAILFIPRDAASDAGSERGLSSFAQSVKVLRHRAGRRVPSDDPELFEALFVGLYDVSTAEVTFFGVDDSPPRNRLPTAAESFDMSVLLERIEGLYNMRNDPPFHTVE